MFTKFFGSKNGMSVTRNIFQSTKRDELGSPDGFPPPIQKYTIREMSLVWQMYGGCDFVGSQSRKTRYDDSEI